MRKHYALLTMYISNLIRVANLSTTARLQTHIARCNNTGANSEKRCKLISQTEIHEQKQDPLELNAAPAPALIAINKSMSVRYASPLVLQL